MHSLDTYRQHVQQLAASIKAWSGFVADVARVEVEEAGDGWRFAMTPSAPGACPVEVVLDGRELRCDLRIAGETVEDWRPPSLDVFLPLMKAVADGNVVTRVVSSAVTTLPIATSTHVRLADGRNLVVPELPDVAAERVEAREVHYLPYRRPGT